MDEKQKTISLSAIGLDSPGLVHRITRRVFDLGGNIIDVEEHCRRGLFSIFLAITFPINTESNEDVVASLRGIEDETGLKVVVGEYHETGACESADEERHLVTILGTDRPGLIARISGLFLRHNINIESCKMIARGEFFSMEMIVDSTGMTSRAGAERALSIDGWKGELKDLCSVLDQSVVIQSGEIFTRPKKLVVFDLESTLLEASSLRVLFEALGRELKPGHDTRSFQGIRGGTMDGVEKAAGMLGGMSVTDFAGFGSVLRLRPGSKEVIRILKSMGFKVALLSSGLDLFVKEIFREAGVDYAFSNTLQVDEEGRVTGKLEEPVIADNTKEDILRFIMNVEKIGRDQVIAIGDGSTRSHFIKQAGLSIAFKPGEKSVKTDGILSSDQIMNLLYCLGIPRAELRRYLEGDLDVRQKDPGPHLDTRGL